MDTSMLVTKCVGDNFEMLTALAILVTIIFYILTKVSEIKTQKMSPFLSRPHHDVTNIPVA